MKGEVIRAVAVILNYSVLLLAIVPVIAPKGFIAIVTRFNVLGIAIIAKAFAVKATALAEVSEIVTVITLKPIVEIVMSRPATLAHATCGSTSKAIATNVGITVVT